MYASNVPFRMGEGTPEIAPERCPLVDSLLSLDPQLEERARATKHFTDDF